MKLGPPLGHPKHSHGVSGPPLLRPTGMKLGPPLGHPKHSLLLQGKPETPAREPVLADNNNNNRLKTSKVALDRLNRGLQG